MTREEEAESIVQAMEAMGVVECGPKPEHCVNSHHGEGRTCTVHRERERTMAEAWRRLGDLEEEIGHAE